MAKQRKTIGENPLDALVPNPEAATEVSRRGLAPAGTYREEEKTQPVEKGRLTVHVPYELMERVKNAVYWTPGVTLAGFAEEALARLVDEMEKENGGPFKKRRHELTGGRPLK